MKGEKHPRKTYLLYKENSPVKSYCGSQSSRMRAMITVSLLFGHAGQLLYLLSTNLSYFHLSVQQLLAQVVLPMTIIKGLILTVNVMKTMALCLPKFNFAILISSVLRFWVPSTNPSCVFKDLSPGYLTIHCQIICNLLPFYTLCAASSPYIKKGWVI